MPSKILSLILIKLTKNPVHVRDSVDIQKIMVTVLAGSISCNVFGMYNIGNQTLSYLNLVGIRNTNDWHHYIVSMVGYDHTSFIAKMWFGAAYFLPIYITVFVVGIAWEALFAIVRKHEINEGRLCINNSIFFKLPPDLPLWQAAMGITFGIVIGKEIFGGTGKNF